LNELLEYCNNVNESETAENLQNKVYSIAKSVDYDLKAWFGCIYKVLLGQNQGPRVGSFIALYGAKNMAKLIEEKLS
jgi:lysyl-tRNA synthetase class 1